MSTFAVFHNYGDYEGWKFTRHGEMETLAEAIEAREDELRNMGGGEVIIVEIITPKEAYKRVEP